MKKNYQTPKYEIPEDLFPVVGFFRTSIRMIRRALDDLTDSPSIKERDHEIRTLFLRRLGDLSYTGGVAALNLFYAAGIDYLINK